MFLHQMGGRAGDFHTMRGPAVLAYIVANNIEESLSQTQNTKERFSSDPTTSHHGICMPTFIHMCMCSHIHKHHTYKHMHTQQLFNSFFFFLNTLHSLHLKCCCSCAKINPKPFISPVCTSTIIFHLSKFLPSFPATLLMSTHISTYFPHVTFVKR